MFYETYKNCLTIFSRSRFGGISSEQFVHKFREAPLYHGYLDIDPLLLIRINSTLWEKLKVERCSASVDTAKLGFGR